MWCMCGRCVGTKLSMTQELLGKFLSLAFSPLAKCWHNIAIPYCV